jgi:hypothetical protein
VVEVAFREEIDMSSEENKAALLTAIGAFNDPQRREEYFGLYADRVVLHRAPPLIPGIDPIKEWYRSLWRAHAMIRRLAVSFITALATAAQAQQWVERYDPLAFDKLPPIWCNAERTACAVSREPYGATGALRVALTVTGTPDCKYRRPRYIFVKQNGEQGGDLSRVQEVIGSTCLLDVPMSQIEGTRLLRFSVPMLTQDSIMIELSLEGLDLNRLAAGRL